MLTELIGCTVVDGRFFKIDIYIYIIHMADENITGAHRVKSVYVALPMHVCSNCGITSYKYSL